MFLFSFLFDEEVDMEKLSEDDLVIATMERDRLIAEGETRVLQLREQIKFEYPLPLSPLLSLLSSIPFPNLL